jgi:hypothetical protein
MGKMIKIKNNLECKMIMREGNAGVYRQLAVVAPGKHYSLKIDPNATYREYVLITLEPDFELPPFSSDDITEFKEIVVKQNPEWKNPDQNSTDPKSTDPKSTDSKSTDPNSTVPKYYWEGDPIYDTKPGKDAKKEETATDVASSTAPEEDAKKQETATDPASSSNHGDGLQTETVSATPRNQDAGLQLKTDSATCEKPGFLHGLVQKGLNLFRKSSA